MVQCTIIIHDICCNDNYSYLISRSDSRLVVVVSLVILRWRRTVALQVVWNSRLPPPDASSNNNNAATTILITTKTSGTTEAESTTTPTMIVTITTTDDMRRRKLLNGSVRDPPG